MSNITTVYLIRHSKKLSNELVNHDETFAGGDINFTSAIDYLGFDSAWYYDAASTTE